jgi:hypothetical protein
MKKKLLLWASMFAMLFTFSACDDGDDVSETPQANSSVQNIAVNATLASTTSTEGILANFSTSDYLRVKFLNAAGVRIGRISTLYLNNGDGTKTGTFANQKVYVPNDATTMSAYVDHGSSAIALISDSAIVDNLASQDGSAQGAIDHSVIYGTTDVSNLSNATMNLEYKTATIKLNVALPSDATDLTATNISAVLQNPNMLNKVNILNGQATAESKKGNITVGAGTFNNASKTFTSYITVWPVANELNDTKLVVTVGNQTFVSRTATLGLSNIKAGNVYEVNASVKFDHVEFDYWYDDAAMSISGVTATVLSKPDWIIVSGGKANIAANATGKARSGSLVLDDGRQFNITQIGLNDFKGAWTFNARCFNGNGSVTTLSKGTINGATVNVTIGDAKYPAKAVSDGVATHDENIGITGLYQDAVLDGTVDIDYKAHKVVFGVLFNRNTIQTTSKGYNVAFLPELATAFSWGGYDFAPGDKVFSDNNKCWLMFNLDDTYSNGLYQFRPTGQKTPNGNYGICGISIVKSTDLTPANLAGSYDAIYQANYNKDDSKGMWFAK